jgi:hypothetical protein
MNTSLSTRWTAATVAVTIAGHGTHDHVNSPLSENAQMNPVDLVRSNAARIVRTLAVAGLLCAVAAGALVSVVGARGDTGAGAPGTVRSAAHQPGALGATHAYTEPPTATATVTETTPVATDTATETPTAAPSSTPSATPTPMPTMPPQPVFLPVSLLDPVCVPEGHYSDIVFVLDVSTYMDKLAGPELASEWAKDWMRATVQQLDLTHTRIGIVQFKTDVKVVQELTNNRQDLLAAIDMPPDGHSATARMDLGLRTGRNLLIGDRATPGNAKVIFFISMMQAKNVPWHDVPGCVRNDGEECAVLAAADEVKRGSGVTVYSLATSWFGNGLLKGVASDAGKNYLLPGDAELATIFSEVQQVKACPPVWPRTR